jgi:S1-C subfamily serine protease
MTTPVEPVLTAFSNSLADLIAQIEPSVVAIRGQRRRSTSGVHWRSGIIVTSAHAMHREEEMEISLTNGRTAMATLMGRDPGTDLALLRLNDAQLSLPVAPIGDATKLKVGHLVAAIARSNEGDISAGLGIIASLGGGWRTWHGGRIDQFIRPSLNLYQGYSGSPLVTMDGAIVGINTAARHTTLTLPAATVNRIVDQLVRGGRVARGYLGLGMQPVQLPETLRRSLNLEQSSGVIIVSVEPGAPADQAAVLIGDILIGLGGNPVGDICDVHAMLDADRVGNPITAQIIRGGVIVELAITVGDRPGETA